MFTRYHCALAQFLSTVPQSIRAASLAVGIFAVLLVAGEFPLQAQSACTSGQTDGTGCGTSEDPPEPSLLATMASGSDVQIDLEYDTENGVEISGELPAGTDAVFVGFDTQLGTYRSFDLGGMSTTSNTSANQTRILNWLATVDPNDSRDANDVAAMLADVDSAKNDLTAYALRACQVWAVGQLTTYDLVLIPLVRTTNTTTLTVYDGGATLSGDVDCWTANPSPVGTRWYTQTCRIIPRIWPNRSYSLAYHRAYNDNFPLLPRVTSRHWVYARFEHNPPSARLQFVSSISPSGARILLMVWVTSSGTGGDC